MTATPGFFDIWELATDEEIDAVLAIDWEDHRGEANQAYSALYKGETCCPFGVLSDRQARYPHQFSPDPSSDQIGLMLDSRLPDPPEEMDGEEVARFMVEQSDALSGLAEHFIMGWDEGLFELAEFRAALTAIKARRAGR